MVPSHDPIAYQAVPTVEQRASPRYRILQRCFIRPPGVSAPDGWRGIVYSLSHNGIGITLPLAVERGTEVEIEAWNLPGVAPLKARVVHITRLDSVWLAGCELFARLTDDERDTWLATITAGA